MLTTILPRIAIALSATCALLASYLLLLTLLLAMAADTTACTVHVSSDNSLKDALLSNSSKPQNQSPEGDFQITVRERERNGHPFSILQKMGAEMIASFVLVFTICAVKLNTEKSGDGTLQVAVIGGLSVLISIVSVGHISGSHINPVVTMAYAAVGHFPLKSVPLYLLAQLIGSILATLLLRVIYHPLTNIGLASPVASSLQSVVIETLACFLLLFVASAVSTDSRAIGELAAIAVGSVISIDILIASPISGGGLNPARVLGPAIVACDFKHVWIYIVGPVIGAFLGAITYKMIKWQQTENQETQSTKRRLFSGRTTNRNRSML